MYTCLFNRDNILGLNMWHVLSWRQVTLASECWNWAFILSEYNFICIKVYDFQFEYGAEWYHNKFEHGAEWYHNSKLARIWCAGWSQLFIKNFLCSIQTARVQCLPGGDNSQYWESERLLIISCLLRREGGGGLLFAFVLFVRLHPAMLGDIQRDKHSLFTIDVQLTYSQMPWQGKSLTEQVCAKWSIYWHSTANRQVKLLILTELKQNLFGVYSFMLTVYWWKQEEEPMESIGNS